MALPVPGCLRNTQKEADGNTAEMEAPVMSREPSREGLGGGFACAGALRWMASSWRHCYPNQSQPDRPSSEGSCQSTDPTYRLLSPSTGGTDVISVDIISSTKEELEVGPADRADRVDRVDRADRADRAADRAADRPGIVSTVLEMVPPSALSSNNTSHIPWGDINT